MCRLAALLYILYDMCVPEDRQSTSLYSERRRDGGVEKLKEDGGEKKRLAEIRRRSKRGRTNVNEGRARSARDERKRSY